MSLCPDDSVIPIISHRNVNMTDAQVLLSCEQCKRRKTKCDKTFPKCSACKLANICCSPVQRSRLPRGRTGNVKHKNSALADKIARLEGLVGRLETEIVERESIATFSGPGTTESTTAADGGTNKIEDLVARDFWTALSKEVVGLRETLERNDGEDSNQLDRAPPQSQSPSQSTYSSLLFSQSPGSPIAHDTYVTRAMRFSLVQVYYDRVDILFKLTHRPTVLGMLACSDQDNVSSKSNVVALALKWCICFTAATTLSDQDCEELHLGPKELLTDHCRVAAETFLSKSNFLIEPSFHSLQAFTIYLMGLRTSGQGALTWTFISLAIRLASALDLDSETNNTLSALDIEQRRRLWFGIGLLDSQAAFGRGSTPILTYTDLKHAPLNINDEEVGVRTVSIHQSTEMCFSCLTHQGIICQRKLCDPSIKDPQVRADIAASFESSMMNAWAHLEFSEIPIEKYTALLAKDMSVNLQLILRRPPYRFVPTDLIINQHDYSNSNDPSFNILQATTTILERGLAKQHSTEFAKWSWFAWPRWYALAILLVELSSILPQLNTTTDHHSKAEIERAYNVALQSFNNNAQSSTELSSGSIWPPIVKLMRHVQKLHGDTTTLDFDSFLNPVSRSSTYTKTPSSQAESQRPDHSSDRTILARYHDALSDYNDTTTAPTQSISETNPDLLWGAFLEDLGETVAAGVSSSNTAMDIDIPPLHGSNMTPRQNASVAAGSTWSLAPYPPMFPHLLPRVASGDGGQGHERSEEGTQRAQRGQKRGQEQTSSNPPASLTLMANGKEGRSVVGRVFDFM